MHEVLKGRENSEQETKEVDAKHLLFLWVFDCEADLLEIKRSCDGVISYM